MESTLDRTFDPTVVDHKEFELLAKSKWLPPLAYEATLKVKPPKVSTTHPHIVHKRPHVIPYKCRGFDKFPQVQLNELERARNTLRLNQGAKYLSTLNELAIENERRQRIEQKRRQAVTIEKYDWNLVKKISQEHQFSVYIDYLKSLGRKLLLETDEAEKPSEQAKALDHHLKTNSRKGSMMLNTKIRPRAYLTRSAKKQAAVLKEDEEFLAQTKEKVESSPFRPKPKGQLSMRRQYPDMDPNYELGRSTLQEEAAAEFVRLLNDFETLGETLKNRSKALESDTECFTIAPTIVIPINQAAAIEAMQGIAKLQSRQGQRLLRNDDKTPNQSSEKSSISTIKKEFETYRQKMHQNIEAYLVTREKCKFLKSLHVKDMAKISEDTLKKVNGFKASTNQKQLPPISCAWVDPNDLDIRLKSIDIGLKVEGQHPAKVIKRGRGIGTTAMEDLKALMMRLEFNKKADEEARIRAMFEDEMETKDHSIQLASRHKNKN